MISVLMPFRDAAETVGEALESVLTEGDPLSEVLCIDDGSQDSGGDVVRKVMERDHRVRVVETLGIGVARALSVGLSLARHGYIARMDADDVSLPRRLGAQLDRLHGEKTLAAVGSRVEPFGSFGAGTERYVSWLNGLVTPREHWCDRFVESPLCHPSVMLRREALESVGGYKEVDGPEDWDLWLRLIEAGWSLAKVPEVFLRWRHHAKRVTVTDPRQSLEGLRRVRAPYLARWLTAVGKPVVIWGAGPTGKRLARSIEAHGVHAQGFVDIDPTKHGRTARGVRIADITSLRRGEAMVLIAVGAAGARDEVKHWLGAKGWVDGEDFAAVS